MSPADRLLASLAAALAPEHAAALLARLGSANGGARAHAERLVRSSRAERLSAVAAALAAVHAQTPGRPAPSCERTRVGDVLLAVRLGFVPRAEVSAALIRICREQLGP